MARPARPAGPYAPRVVTPRNAARLETGQTLAELSKRIGCCPATLHRWEQYTKGTQINVAAWSVAVYGSTPDLFEGFDFSGAKGGTHAPGA